MSGNDDTRACPPPRMLAPLPATRPAAMAAAVDTPPTLGERITARRESHQQDIYERLDDLDARVRALEKGKPPKP